MSRQSKSGNVRGGMRAILEHDVAANVVQLNHAGTGSLKNFLGTSAVAMGGRDESGAEGLGQDELVARFGSGVGDDLLWMNDSGDGQAEFNLCVADGMTSHDDRAGGLASLASSSEYFSQPIQAFLIIGISDQI